MLRSMVYFLAQCSYFDNLYFHMGAEAISSAEVNFVQVSHDMVCNWYIEFPFSFANSKYSVCRISWALTSFVTDLYAWQVRIAIYSLYTW